MLLEFGQVAKGCRTKCQCSEYELDDIQCPVCEGECCDYCDKKGRIYLRECPRLMLDNEMLELQHAAGLYEKGLPPVAGGTRDQSRWFTEATRYYWAEQSVWKAKLET